jgi:hypothetical protein
MEANVRYARERTSSGRCAFVEYVCHFIAVSDLTAHQSIWLCTASLTLSTLRCRAFLGSILRVSTDARWTAAAGARLTVPSPVHVLDAAPGAMVARPLYRTVQTTDMLRKQESSSWIWFLRNGGSEVAGGAINLRCSERLGADVDQCNNQIIPQSI